ncbi:transcriptional activator RinB [Staphylococcus hominis]
MFKKLIKMIYLIGMLVIGMYLTKQAIVILESEDDIDAPADYALNGDQADIDIAFRENKASNVSKPPHLGIKWTKE